MTIHKCNMQADLIFPYMLNFDVIMGINRLSFLCAVLECFGKTVILVMPSIPPVVWQGPCSRPSTEITLYVRAQSLVSSGVSSYFAFIGDFSKEGPITDFVPVVREFVDVFSTDLLGLHPERDIDLSINLNSSTHSISILQSCIEPLSLKSSIFSFKNF